MTRFMPATPAWPPHSAPRLYVATPLSGRDAIDLDGSQAHYLITVMRSKVGDAVSLFDDISGEYLALVDRVGKRDLTLRIDRRTRPREDVPDLWLCAAPIKRARYDWVAENARELGVARFQPVLAARSVVDRIKPDRLRKQMVEAAEQCERTALPEIAPLTKLAALVAGWPRDRHLFFAYERGGMSFRKALVANAGPAAILIGPEGGFTDDEEALIAGCDRAVPVSLGPRILRADTAAVAAVSLWMAGRGDW